MVTLIKRKQSSSADAALTFESATAEAIAYHPWVEQGVLYTLAAFIVFTILFISVAQLDRIVTATGRLVPVSGTVTVQPLDKAILNRILVSVGDRVKKGQVLATLDPTFVEANLAQLQEKVANFDAQKRRLEAEESGRPFQSKPTEASDALQSSLWKQRSTEFQAGAFDYDQRISSSEAQVAGLRRSVAEYQERLKIAVETERMYSELVKVGTATHLQLIGVQDQKLETERKLVEAEHSLASTEHILASLREQRKVYINKWHDQNLTNLASVKDQLEQATDDLSKAKKMSELANLTAPMDAIVLQIPKLSTGGVAMDAEPLFSLMPVDAPVEVDVQIDTKDSGFVKVGDPVRIKFETYRFLEHGVAEGVVKTISQDSFTEDPGQDVVTGRIGGGKSRAPFFAARIAITAVKLHDVPTDIRLMPGMTLQADIIVGRRTIMWYLFSGAIRSGKEAMHEP